MIVSGFIMNYLLQPYKDIWYAYYPEKDQWVIADSPRADKSIGYYEKNYRIDQAIEQFKAQLNIAKGKLMDPWRGPKTKLIPEVERFIP